MIGLLLGTGLGGWRRASPSLPGQGAPVCLRRPAVLGTGRIGSLHEADPGLWQGAERFEFAWTRDGAAIPGATGPGYRPGPAEDGARLEVRVTARNSRGSREERSENHLFLMHEPPAAAMRLPDLVLVQDSGEHYLNASTDFSGSALTFGVTGEGVSIDPATGLLTVRTDALREGVTVTVTATNSGGTATSRFTLTIAADGTAPALTAAPVLVGDGRIGAPVAVDPGSWSGEPAPALALQWLIDGAAIPDATGASYLPIAGDDGRALACRVVATNPSGRAEAVTDPLAVTQVPPAATGALADVSAVQGGAPVTVEAGAAFAGAGLVFAVEGAGAAIDAATGVVTLATDVLRAAEPVTVTATNSGGSAKAGFAFSVVEASVPPALVAAPSLVGTGEIGTEVTVLPGEWSGAPAPDFAFQWLCAGEAIAGATGPVYAPVAADDGRPLVARVTASNAAGAAEAVTEAVLVRHVAPTETGTLPDRVFPANSGFQTVAAAEAFTGAALVFTVEGGGATVDPASGVVTLPTEIARREAVTVTAANSGGTAKVAFQVSVTAAPGAPAPLDTPGDLLYEQGTGEQTVSGQALFSGEGLAYALVAAPEGVTVNAASGLVRILTEALLPASRITVRAANGAGIAEQTFTVAVLLTETDLGDLPAAAQAGDWNIEQITVQA